MVTCFELLIKIKARVKIRSCKILNILNTTMLSHKSRGRKPLRHTRATYVQHSQSVLF